MLWESAHALKIYLSFTKDDVIQAIQKTVRKNDIIKNGYLRIQITRGKMMKSFMNPSLAMGETSLVIFPDLSPLNNNVKGAKIITSSIRRPSPDILDQKIHSCNKLNSLLAKIQANIVGADEALMLDDRGFVAECSTTNIFIIKNGNIFTPLPHSCKLGVTRQTIIDGAREIGYLTIEKDISLYEIYNSDECFYCGTHGGITSVIEIDGRKIGNGKLGIITNTLLTMYDDLCNKNSISLEIP
jgi:branched-chain amino acid aminotransferase